MNKRVALLFAMLTVSVASAATLKMKEFCQATGPDQDGVATLHYAPGPGATKIHITITGFDPGVTYGVAIGANLAGEGTAIVANNGGNGEVSYEIIGDITGSSQTITIYIDDNNDNRFDLMYDTFVAQGTAR